MNNDKDSDSSSQDENDEDDGEDSGDLGIGRQSAFSSGVFRLMSQ